MQRPFEPRVVLPEPAPLDDAGELELPDDLAALAEQLQDDAAHLSTRFRLEASPAATPLPGATARSPSSAPMRIALLTTAAATIAIALSVASLANRSGIVDQADRQPQSTAAETSADTSHEPIAIEAIQHPHADPAAQNTIDQSESLVLLGEASGPEREGLLDLLQQTASTETSISF